MKSRETQAATLFLAHHGFVKGLALKHAPWPGLADDIVQQVIVEFLGKADEWDLTADLRPLLATMTRHVALRHWREQTRKLPEVAQRLAEHIRQIAEAQLAPPRYEEELTALQSCLDKLPGKSRTLVDLYYFADVPTREIAAQLAMKADTVLRAICRLRERLRQCINRELAGGASHG